MSSTFEDRVEEVLGALHGMAWPLLDEAEKRKITGKIVQGIDKHEDTQAMWCRALRVSSTTLSRRIEHFRRSEPIDDSAQDKENREKAVRHAKVVMRDPDAAAEVIGSLKPAEREAVFDAAAASLDRATDNPRVTVPQMDPWSDATLKMEAIDRQLIQLSALIDRTRMTGNREADLEEWTEIVAARIHNLTTKDGRAELRLVVGGE
jgi:hypothetical protein